MHSGIFIPRDTLGFLRISPAVETIVLVGDRNHLDSDRVRRDKKIVLKGLEYVFGPLERLLIVTEDESGEVLRTCKDGKLENTTLGKRKISS